MGGLTSPASAASGQSKVPLSPLDVERSCALSCALSHRATPLKAWPARDVVWRTELLLPAVAQTGCKAIDRQVNPGDDILIRVAGAIALEQLDLHVVERIEIGEAVADRARQ